MTYKIKDKVEFIGNDNIIRNGKIIQIRNAHYCYLIRYSEYDNEKAEYFTDNQIIKLIK